MHVRGVTVGDAQLEVLIGGRERHAPTFPLKVLDPQAFKITAWIVSDAENNGARRIEDVQAMIAPLNDIYRQVGVSFYLDTVTVTNIPGAYNLPYDSSTNDLWNVDRLVDIGHDTGGIECYFVKSLERSNNKPGPLACNNQRGIVLSAEASCITFAHEIGHAFGLSDIYASNREKDAEILQRRVCPLDAEVLQVRDCFRQFFQILCKQGVLIRHETVPPFTVDAGLDQ